VLAVWRFPQGPRGWCRECADWGQCCSSYLRHRGRHVCRIYSREKSSGGLELVAIQSRQTRPEALGFQTRTALSDICRGLFAVGWYGRVELRSEELRSEGPADEEGLDEDMLM